MIAMLPVCPYFIEQSLNKSLKEPVGSRSSYLSTVISESDEGIEHPLRLFLILFTRHGVLRPVQLHTLHGLHSEFVVFFHISFLAHWPLLENAASVGAC